MSTEINKLIERRKKEIKKSFKDAKIEAMPTIEAVYRIDPYLVELKTKKAILKKIDKIGEEWQIAQEDSDGEFEHTDFKDTSLFDTIKEEISS